MRSSGMSGHHDRQSFGGEMAQQMQNLNTRMVSVDVNEFIRTRDAVCPSSSLYTITTQETCNFYGATICLT